MKKIALALFAAAVTASPVAAGVAWNWGSPVCGGTSFETCISANVAVSGSQIIVTIGNMGPGTITGVGLWNLPTGVAPTSASASIVGWNSGGTNDINGVVGDNAAKYAIGTTNGINDGLTPSGIAPGNVATFTFNFSSATAAASAMASIGIGVHSQGYIGCSTKLFLSGANDVANPYGGGADNCLSVPEPGSLFLLGSGAAGMAFVASRRRKNVELIDEDGNDVAI